MNISFSQIQRLVLLLAVTLSVAGHNLMYARDTLSYKQHDLAFNIGHTDSSKVHVSNVNIGLLGGAAQLHGFQFNVMTSFARNEMHGFQLSGLSGVAKDMRGVQLSAFSNVSLSPFRGLQLGGVTNISRGVDNGVQFSALTNISSSAMRGLQFGTYNYADTLHGWQVGAVNVCLDYSKGVQLGLINFSNDTIVRNIGLVNINPKTKTDFMFFGGNSSKINAAVRFRNRSTYRVIGFGTHYLGLDEKFSGAIYYRVGQYVNLGRRWMLSADAGFFHVETFQHNSADKPERLYSLQFRANVDYKLSDRAGIFASAGYGFTRYYNHNRQYRSRPIFEAGVSLAYDRSRPVNRADDAGHRSTVSDTASVFAFDNPLNMKKHPWRAAAEAVGINVLVNSFDRFVLNEDFAKVSLSSIKENFKTGFVWDNDQFSTNLFAHPYHGGLYFNSARSNGMSFWESAPYALGGSLMWELACEVEPPAINDLMATTFGGICIGEVTHRVSNLIYDDRERGVRRFLREFAGVLVCPVRAFNRLLTGDAWRVRHDYYKYHDYNRIPVDFTVSVGDRYLADEGGMFRGEHNPYIDLWLSYGDAFDGDGAKPYDYFTANVTFGLSGNQPLISSVHLLGKLWGKNFYEEDDMTAVFGLFQHFNYYDSEAVKDGTARVPYRISEAAAFGPGLIYKFPRIANVGSLEQRVFLDAILLGGSLSDYYNVIDRDYNMGSGYSAKVQTVLEFSHFGRFTLNADFYSIYTWKGYELKDFNNIDPLHLNAQGDKSSAALLVINPRLQVALGKSWYLDIFASYYMRETRYKYHENVRSDTFEVRGGISYSF